MMYDQDFIREEKKCDWIVTETTKKVWWIQLDLVKQLDRICKKHNLRWYPMWGTLLGVIRHKGYIPWDDDMDVVMPRADYEKLIAICQTELSNPYFLQTTLNDKQCYYMWVTLRNSNTTGNRETCLSKQQNNGIGIDIMPLDGCQDKPLAYKISRFPVRVATVLANTYVNEFNTGKIAVILRKFLRLFKFNYKKAYLWAEKQNKKFKWENYNRVAFRAHADPLTKVIQRDMWLKEDFATTIDMPFENITIPVPCGYDRILKQIYGDYMKFPPMDKRQGKHDMVFEPDIPYKEYCSEHYGVKYDD
ncbi:MAG: LicD family protein [Clostridia bacterium]|nr:LicD family protein [Clostridia bacterium]